MLKTESVLCDLKQNWTESPRSSPAPVKLREQISAPERTDFAELTVSLSLPLGCSCLNVLVPLKRSENTEWENCKGIGAGVIQPFTALAATFHINPAQKTVAMK